MTVGFRVIPYGRGAALVELEDLDGVLAYADRVRRAVAAREEDFAQVVDVVPAARTVLVTLRDGRDATGLRAALSRLDVDRRRRTAAAAGAEVVEIPVRYDGPDLDAVARHCGLSPADVIAAHAGQRWRVAFGGFAPGFAYLTGGDPRLVVPRRDVPRTTVPAGSVALAGSFSAVYPRSSPGGWQLIGTTTSVLFDPDRESPALLGPGIGVQFREEA